MPRPTPDHSARILTAAADVFARVGFDRARMEDIATGAGVSKGALYLAFASKDDLVDALVMQMMEAEIARLEGIASSPGDVRERLVRLFDDYGRELAAMRELAPLMMETYARATRHGPLRDALVRRMDEYISAVESLIEEGITGGEFRPTDARAASLAFAGLVEGTSLLWLLDDVRVPLAATIEAGVALLLDGLLAGHAKGINAEMEGR